MTGLLFVDLDGFKAVNDGHGHAAGDEVLQEVARRLRSAVRPGDVACRLGGDEFVVLVEPVKGEADLLELAERLIAAVSEPMTADGALVGSAPASASRSAATAAPTPTSCSPRPTPPSTGPSDTAGAGAEIFDDAAPAAAHRARGAGGGHRRTASPHGEMQLYYQPVIDVGSDRITGYEALVRWNRPGHRHGAAGPVHPRGRGLPPDLRPRPLGPARGHPAAGASGGPR